MGYKKCELRSNSLPDRVKKLLVSLNLSDCCFLIYGREFKAHKLILAMSSPVFEAMFYGHLSTMDNVVIKDIEPEVFQLLLQYMYTDKIEINTVEQAFELLYASRKYMLEDLTEMCVTYIQDVMTTDNVITVLNYPDYIQDTQLLTQAVKLFCNHANYLLQKNKNVMSISCMQVILASHQINIAEKDLINHVFEWTSCYCRENNIADTMENRRSILITYGIFKLLRLLILTVDELNELVSHEYNLLLPNEYEHVKEFLKSTKVPEEDNVIARFGTTVTPRKTIKPEWRFCHLSSLRSVAPTMIDQNNSTLHFRIKTNKSIFINCLFVPTRLSPWAYHNNNPKAYIEQFSVSILNESDNSIINFTQFSNKVQYNSTMDIELSELCFIKKNVWHRISCSWPQNKCQTKLLYPGTRKDKMYKDHKISIKCDDMSEYPHGGFLSGIKFCF